MKYLFFIIPIAFLLSACSSSKNTSTEINSKLCQQYSDNYNITVCDKNLAKIWNKIQAPGTGSLIINLSDFSEINCPVINPNLLDKKCLEKLQCSPITCN